MVLVVPRAGVEVGKRVKWRTSVEHPVAMRIDMKETVTGLSVTTGVGLRVVSGALDRREQITRA